MTWIRLLYLLLLAGVGCACRTGAVEKNAVLAAIAKAVILLEKVCSIDINVLKKTVGIVCHSFHDIPYYFRRIICFLDI